MNALVRQDDLFRTRIKERDFIQEICIKDSFFFYTFIGGFYDFWKTKEKKRGS